MRQHNELLRNLINLYVKRSCWFLNLDNNFQKVSFWISLKKNLDWWMNVFYKLIMYLHDLTFFSVDLRHRKASVESLNQLSPEDWQPQMVSSYSISCPQRTDSHRWRAIQSAFKENWQSQMVSLYSISYQQRTDSHRWQAIQSAFKEDWQPKMVSSYSVSCEKRNDSHRWQAMQSAFKEDWQPQIVSYSISCHLWTGSHKW